MNRCALATWLAAALSPAVMAPAALALPLAAVLMSATAAVAQPVVRQFPATALRGTLEVTQPPEVLVNGEPARLSPGSRIRGVNNLLQMSAALVGQPLLVHYTRDTLGNVHLVWILSPEEAQKKPWPSTPEQAERWAFDPSAQTWTRR